MLQEANTFGKVVTASGCAAPDMVNSMHQQRTPKCERSRSMGAKAWYAGFYLLVVLLTGVGELLGQRAWR
jgi:hypothetical protein